MNPHYYPATIRFDQDRGDHRTYSRNCDVNASTELDSLNSLPAEIRIQPVGRSFRPLRIENGFLFMQEVPQKTRSHIAVEQVVLKSIPEASQASIAATIAVSRT